MELFLQLFFCTSAFRNKLFNRFNLLQLEATLKSAEYTKNEWETYFKDAQWETYENADIKRQVMFLSVLGTPALDPVSLEAVSIF
jgi:hypothetical protein